MQNAEYPPRVPLSLDQAHGLLQDAPFRWRLAGGWALDVFLGRQTRPHSDVDVAILRTDQERLVQILDGWEFSYDDIRSGTRHVWFEGHLLSLPIHELWARQRGSAAWQLEFLLNEADHTDWIFRRDRSVRLPLGDLNATRKGLPFLPPAVVLLYKSNNLTDKNQRDFEVAFPNMDRAARRWLRLALTRTDPNHPWLSVLST